MKYVTYTLGALFLLAVGWSLVQARHHRQTVEELNALHAEAVEKVQTLEAKLEAAAKEKRIQAPEPVSSPSPVIESPLAVELETNEEVTVTAVDVNGGEGPRPMNEATLNAIQRFDYAMDREFNRLDEREKESSDQAEVATITVIKEKLGDLDELYIRADQATTDEERVEIRQEMQKTMGSIIGLSRQDRNERLSKLATDIGYEDPKAVQQFVREIDRVYRETHMDWTKLFNRTPPAMVTAGDRSVSPGMQQETPDQAEP